MLVERGDVLSSNDSGQEMQAHLAFAVSSPATSTRTLRRLGQRGRAAVGALTVAGVLAVVCAAGVPGSLREAAVRNALLQKQLSAALPASAPVVWPAVSNASSLYCFSHMMPFGSELHLLQSQYEHSAGIFQCDAYDVFSNATIDVALGLTTYAVPGPIVVPHGGALNLALNTNVFIRMWRAVLSIGTYKQHAWSLKLDPDCVFLPERFRDLISRTSIQELPLGAWIPSGKVFLENCEYGMLGSVEVLSRDAMDTFLDKMDSCEDIRQAAMDIFPAGMPENFDEADHAFGEDQYLRTCLVTLGVTKVDEYQSLLSDASACVVQTVTNAGQPTDCTGAYVAFHAYSSAPDWLACWHLAHRAGHWPSSALLASGNATSVPIQSELPVPSSEPLASQAQKPWWEFW